MILFFDTETTGVPKNYKAPVSDVDNYPRLVQLGYILVSGGEELYSREFLIKPNGFEIPVEASNVHGITTEKATQEGHPVEHVLADFLYWADEASLLVGHNVQFDLNVIGAELWRMTGTNQLEGKPHVCTMMASIDFCQLPGKYGYKYPKLTELWRKLFGSDLPQTHTALDDIRHTLTCYNALIERGILAAQ